MMNLHQRNLNRTPLETVVPLPAPFTLHIEPSSYCNFQCNFCPTGDRELIKSVGIIPQIMEMELFNKIINDIAELPQKIKCIIFQGNGEPTFNRHLPEMIRRVKKEYGCEHVELTTNGSLLNPNLINQLIDAGLDKIKISIDGLSETDYNNNCRFNIKFEEFIDNLRYLYQNKKQCVVYIKTIDFIAKGREELFYNMFREISDDCFIEFSLNWTANNLKQFSSNSNKVSIDGLPITAGRICPFSLWLCYIAANGDVCACVDDWSKATCYGNVQEESYSEIWNGKRLYEFRMMHLNNEENKNNACRNCDYRNIAIENIDDVAHILKEKLEQGFSKGNR